MSTKLLAVALALCAVLVAVGVMVDSGSDDEATTPLPDTTSKLPDRGITIEGAAAAAPGLDLHLVGSGLPPELGVVAVPCGNAALDRSSPTACDYRHAQRATTTPDGVVDLSFGAVRYLSVDDQMVDCATASCAISVLALTEPTTELHREDLVFAELPTRPFDVVVEPRSGLGHLQELAVSGSWEAATIELCNGDECDAGSRVDARSGPVTVVVPAGVVGRSGSIRLCADAACSLRVTTEQGVVETPLQFDAAPLPEVHAELRSANSASVLALQGLLGTWYRAEFCEVAFLAAADEVVRCEPATADPTWGPAALAMVPVELPDFCALVCEVRITSGAGDAFAALIEVPVDPPAPEVTLAAVAGSTPAVGGTAEFAVTGTDSVLVALCHADAADVSAATCGVQRTVSVDASGVVRVPVGSSIEVDGTEVSCNALDQLCAVVATAAGSVDRVLIKAAAPAKPGPAATLSRADDGIWVLEPTVALVAQRCAEDPQVGCEPPVLLRAGDDSQLVDALDPSACSCVVRIGSIDGSLAPILDAAAAG